MEVEEGYVVKLGDIVTIQNRDTLFERKVIRVGDKTFSIKLNAYVSFTFDRVYKRPLKPLNDSNQKLKFSILKDRNVELKVVKCSIRVMNGIVINGHLHRRYKYYEGYSHHQITKENNLKNVPPFDQGFLLSNGEWVKRDYAAKIAYQAKQIDKPCRQLYSEMIPEFLNKTIIDE